MLETSAFSHMTMEHLIYNMIGLYFFGYNTGRNFGREFLLNLYLARAFGGSIFYSVHHAFMHSQWKGQGMFSIDPSRMPGLGASGAVNAIMLLDIFLFPKATLYIDFIIPVPALLLGIFLVGKDVLRIIQETVRYQDRLTWEELQLQLSHGPDPGKGGFKSSASHVDFGINK